MTRPDKEQILFDVETTRVLQILSSEIYDSPKAFLRENVQNAYDAILMRCEAQQISADARSITVTITGNNIVVTDDGIGMTEEVLKDNFWRAGSSGKKSPLAQRAGVIGTFGIGAMANFGVCEYLRVETRHIDSDVTLISSARREDLKIAQHCVDLERVPDRRAPGTSIIAELDPSGIIDATAACEYLKQYVRFLPVPVSVNGQLISQEHFDGATNTTQDKLTPIACRTVVKGAYQATLDVSTDDRSRLVIHVTDLALQGQSIQGRAFFVQRAGSIQAYRNHFGLAAAPVPTDYGLAGFVNLDILTPTAGREALSRQSIQHITDLIRLVEAEATVDLADTNAADNNQQFQQYIYSHTLTTLARNVCISVRPAEEMIALGATVGYQPEKTNLYYAGTDQITISRHANEQANLFHISQVNPRRGLQLRYLRDLTRLGSVPDTPTVELIPEAQLSLEEAIFLIAIRNVLLEDYLMPNIEAHLATISHGVAVHVASEHDVHHISISRNLPAVTVVTEYYRTASDVFDGFVKDFVRHQIYPHIRADVPSSQKQGHDALYKRLQANKELYRLQKSDYGDIESLLADFLSGKVEFSEVIRTSGRRSPRQRQEVSNEQIGTFEEELPDIIDSPTPPSESEGFFATPPILRPKLTSNMKVLTVAAQYSQLNHFQMFLAVSDRMASRDGVFLRQPHTTRLIWGAHRITYIFTNGTGQISLYYDIELKTPLETDQTGGRMFPTTTIVTENRIFVPVPKTLEPAFQATDSTREFYVRFDTIP